MTIADEVFQIFARRGAGAYYGENVCMTEHALQAAHLARIAGAPPPLIVAALLHDIGHLVDEVPDDLADWTEDAHHENVGSAWLSRHFPAEVSEPVRLHVPAKRYLCGKNPAYLSALSPASVVTLKLQGGAMSASEIARFEEQPYYHDAVAIRHWDDQGKIAGLTTPGLAHYRELIETLAAAQPHGAY